MQLQLRAPRRPLGPGSNHDTLMRCLVDKPTRNERFGPSRRRTRNTIAAAGLGGETVDTVVDRTVTFIRFAGDVSKQVLNILENGVEVAVKLVPVVTDTYEKVAPVARRVSESAVDISSTAATVAAPVVKGALKTASDALTDQGVDVGQVQSRTQAVVKTASDVAVPAVQSSFDFLSAASPTVLVYGALAAAGLYFTGPSIFAFLAGVARGYAGDITAAGAVDIILNKGNAFLIDIRTAIEKEKSGVLDVPGNVGGNLIELEFATTQNRKLRGQMENPRDVENRITALQIAALRRLSRSCDVFLLDSDGSTSRGVAKKLKALGFGRCFVVANGFAGWRRLKLQTKPSSMVYQAEVVGPGPVLSSAIRGGTMQRKVTSNDRRALPPGK